MKRVVFRPEAEADLAAIALYTAERSISRARDLVERLRRRTGILAKHPEAGRLRSEFGVGVRSLVEQPYILLYRVVDDAVEIIAILHGARELPTAFAGRILKDIDELRARGHARAMRASLSPRRFRRAVAILELLA